MSPLISELPIAGEEFFGRLSEMDRLCGVLHSHESGRKAVVIWGFGGLGKSRLALQYVKVHQSRYSSILWINAANFVRAVESFSQAASNIKSRDHSILPPTGGEKDIKTVHHWLLRSQAKDDWLLVIDSVDDFEMEFRNLIPQCNRGNIIVTSRLSGIARDLGYQEVELGSIENAAGAEMLLFKSCSSHDFGSRMRIFSFYVSRLTLNSRDQPCGKNRQNPGWRAAGHRTS